MAIVGDMEYGDCPFVGCDVGDMEHGDCPMATVAGGAGMQNLSTRDTTWKDILYAWTRVGGVWVKCKAWLREGGVWVLIKSD